MSRVVFVLATMVAAAAAIPSTFVKVDTYASAQNCTSGTVTPQSTLYYPLDFCVVTNDGARGDKYVFDNSMNNVVQWRYSNNMCTGNASMPYNYSVGICNAQTGAATLSTKKTTVLSSNVGMIQSSSFRVHGCNAADLEQTSFFMQGCNGGATYTVGGKLEICFPSGRGNSDCSGDLTCESVARDCFDQNSDNGADAGSIQYDWSAGSAAAPAVALTAALMAFVAAVTKF